MMPVVDAHVGLSQHEFALNDYLQASDQFHVLRMVAVQQGSFDPDFNELRYFQTQATTRGSGGFPNALVAAVDLAEPDSINALVDSDKLENLRGVVHRSDSTVVAIDMEKCQESLAILNAHNLSLDLTPTVQCIDKIGELAARQSTLPIVVTVPDSTGVDSNQFAKNRMAELANYPNVCIKLNGFELTNAERESGLANSLHSMIEQFGCERIMFASGLTELETASRFDGVWSAFVDASNALRARQRDCLFRSNAIRVYRL